MTSDDLVQVIEQNAKITVADANGEVKVVEQNPQVVIRTPGPSIALYNGVTQALGPVSSPGVDFYAARGDHVHPWTGLELLTGSQTYTGAQTFQPSATTQTPLVVQLLAGQSADAFDVKNGTGGNVFRIDAAGNVTATSFAGSGAGITGIPNTGLVNSALTVTAGTGLSGGGAVSLGGSTTLSLPNVGPGAGNYGALADHTLGVSLDAQGRVTATASTPIQIAEAAVTGLVADLAARAIDNTVVHLAGAENITGIKTFVVNPVFNAGAIPIAALAADTVQVVAGTGLSGGGTPALGGTTTLSLPLVGPGIGTFGGDATHSTTVTLDAQGRVTAVGTTAIVLPEASVTGLVADLAARLTGITAGTGITVTGGAPSPTVAITNTVVVAGAYGDATHVPGYTVNAQGQLTAAASTAIAYPVTSVFGRLGAVVLTAADVDTAMGYTPANDALVAHLAGAESFTGVKTFTANPVFNANAIPNTALATLPLTGLTAGANIAISGASPNLTVALSGVVPAGNLPADVAYLDVAQSWTALQTMRPAATTGVGFIVQGLGLQTGDLQQWKSSTAVLASVSSGGVFTGSGAGLTSIPNAGLVNSAVTVTAGTGLAGGGAVSLGGTVTLSLPLVGPGVGTYGGDAIHTMNATLDAQGRVTAIGTTLIQIAEGQVTNLAADLAARLTGITSGLNISVTGGAPSPTVALTGVVAAAHLPADNAYLDVAQTWTDLQTFTANAATVKGLIVRGAASQSANLQEWQNSTPAVLASVSSAGVFTGSGAGLTSIPNTGLVNSSVTVTAGTGLAGGGAVSLGGSITLSMPAVGPGAGTFGGDATHTMNVTLDAQGRVTAVGTTPVVGGVSSVFGRTGAVVAATGDYTAAQVTNAAATNTGQTFIGSNVFTPAAIAGVPVTVQLLASQSGDAFDVKASGGTVLASISAAGVFSGSGAGLTSIPNVALVNSTIGVTAGTGLSGGGTPALGGSTTLNIASTTVTAGTYGDASHSVTIAVNAQGQLTAASGPAIQISETAVTNLTTDLAARAVDSTVVHLTGSETISGLKTINPSAITAVGLIVQGLASQSGDLQQWKSNAAVLSSVSASGVFTGSGAGLTSIPNSGLVNSAVTVTAGTGLSGGGAVSLGGSVSLSLPAVGPGAGTFGGDATHSMNVTLDAQGRVTAVGTASIVGGVSSVFSRTGAVVAVSGDYTAAQVTNAAAINIGQTFTGVQIFTPDTTAHVPVTIQLLASPTGDALDVKAVGGAVLASISAAGVFSGSGAGLTSIPNAALVNSTIGVVAGTGLSGGGTPALGGTTTLNIANTAVAAGTYGDASHSTTITVNAQGQLTAASGPAIQIAEAAVTNLTTDLAARAIDSTVVHLAGTETVTGAKTFSSLGTFNAGVVVSAGTATTVGTIVRGAASQSADLQQWQSSTPTTMLGVDSGGRIYGSTNAVLVSSNGAGSSSFGFGSTGGNPAVYSNAAVLASFNSSAALKLIGNVSSFPVLIAQGAPSQSGDLTQWQSSTSAVLTSINSSGLLTVTGPNGIGGSVPTSWAARFGGRIGVMYQNRTFYFDASFSSGQFAELSTYDYTTTQPFPMVFQANGGNLTIGTYTQLNLAKVGIINDVAATVGLIVRGATSQSNDLLQVQNSAPVVLVSVGATGDLRVTNTSTTINTAILLNEASASANGYYNYLATASASRIALVVRGVASQASNLQEWQNSTSTAVATIANVGTIWTADNITAQGGHLTLGTATNPFITINADASTYAAGLQINNPIGWGGAGSSGGLGMAIGGVGWPGYGLYLYARGPGATGQPGHFYGASIGPYNQSVYAYTDDTGNKTLAVRSGSFAATVINKALTANVATLTTSAAHGLVVGQVVVVTGVDATFNGTWAITSVPTGTTFTYNVTAANVASVASGGTATGQSYVHTQEWQRSDGTVFAAVHPYGMAFSSVYFNLAGQLRAGPAGLNISRTDNVGAFSSGGVILYNTNPAFIFYTDNTASTLAGLQVGSVGGQAGNDRIFFPQFGQASVQSQLNVGTSGVSGLGALTVLSIGATTPGVVVKGFASQSADLHQWQNSTGTVLGRVGPNAGLSLSPQGLGFIGLNAGLEVWGGTVNAGYPVVVIRGLSGQSGALTTWQNNAGTGVLNITSGGAITSAISGAGFIGASAGLEVNGGVNAGYPVVVLRGLVGQSGDLQQWQSSTGTVLAKVDSAGNFSDVGGAVVHLAGTETIAGAKTFSGSIQTFLNSAGASNTIIVQNTNSTVNVGTLVLRNDLGTSAQLDLSVFASARAAYGMLTPNMAYVYTGNSAGIGIMADNGGILRFAGGSSTESMRVHSDGTVGVNTSSSPGAQFGVYSGLSTRVVEIVRGAASQSANLQEWQNSTPTTVAKIDAGGNPAFPGIGGSTPITLTLADAVVIRKAGGFYNLVGEGQGSYVFAANTFYVGGTSGGSAPTWGGTAAWQYTSGTFTALGNFQVNGSITTTSGGGATLNGGLGFNGASVYSIDFAAGSNAAPAGSSVFLKGAPIKSGLSTQVALIVQGVASQSADLQQWQASTGGVLFAINSAGNISTMGGFNADVRGNSSGMTFFPTGIIANIIAASGGGAQISTTNGAVPFVVSATLATSVPWIVQGAPSQSADLQEWQSSTITLARVNAAGKLGVGSTVTSFNAELVRVGGSVAIVGGAADNNASGATLTLGGGGASPNGTRIGFGDGSGWNLTMGAGTTNSFMFNDKGTLIINPTALSVGLIVKGDASQSADLQQWQNSSGAVLAGVSSSGQIYTNPGAATLEALKILSGASGNYVGMSLGRTAGELRIGVAATAGDWATGTLAGDIVYRVDLSTQTLHFLAGSGTAPLKVNQNQVLITAPAAATVPAIVKGAASQSADLTQWQNSAGTPISGVDIGGRYYGTINGVILSSNGSNSTTYGFGANAGLPVVYTAGSQRVAFGYDNLEATYAGLAVAPEQASHIGLIVRGLTSQSADLLQYRDVNGIALTKIGAAGQRTTYGTGFDSLLAIQAPVATISSGSAGGTFAAGNYFWVVTAINSYGETVASNEVHVILLANQQATISWSQIVGATGYKVYRTTVSGSYPTPALVATVTNGATVSYTDTGTAVTAGTPPTGPVGNKLLIQSWQAQTGNMLELENSSSTVLAYFDSVANLHLFANTSTLNELTVRVLGDNWDRFAVAGSGLHTWGPGNAAVDVGLGRSGAGQLQLNNGVAGTVPANGLMINKLVAWTSSALLQSDFASPYGWVAVSPSASIVPLTARGVAGQTGDLQRWESSTPVTFSSITAGGLFSTTVGTITKVITAGALPTTTFTSGTAKQIATRDVNLFVPFTTTTAAGTLKVELSPDNTTFTTLTTLTPAVTAMTSSVSIEVPANWWVKLTAVSATIGTGIYY